MLIRGSLPNTFCLMRVDRQTGCLLDQTGRSSFSGARLIACLSIRQLPANSRVCASGDRQASERQLCGAREYTHTQQQHRRQEIAAYLRQQAEAVPIDSSHTHVYSMADTAVEAPAAPQEPQAKSVIYCGGESDVKAPSTPPIPTTTIPQYLPSPSLLAHTIELHFR